MSRADISKVERRAHDLFEESGCVKAPVPVERIARDHGAEVRYRAFEGSLSGLLLRDDDSTIIGVHSKQPKVRQRFTIAHELGHLILHEGRPVIVEHLTRVRVNLRQDADGRPSDREEIEANRFAAALLMPEPLLEQDYWRLAERNLPDDAVTTTLANRFHVSEQAMRVRLIGLALIDPV